jgi:hypothetical protein
LLDQEHYVLEHLVVEQALLVILLLNELSKINEIEYIFNRKKKQIYLLEFVLGVVVELHE